MSLRLSRRWIPGLDLFEKVVVEEEEEEDDMVVVDVEERLDLLHDSYSAMLPYVESDVDILREEVELVLSIPLLEIISRAFIDLSSIFLT